MHQINVLGSRRISLLFAIVLSLFAWSSQSSAEEGISVAYCIDCIPFQFTDKNNRPSGILIDYWRLWSEKTGIQVRLIPAAWPQTLTMVGEGRADAHAGLFFNSERDRYLDYGMSLTETDTHIFLHKALPAIDNLEDLSAYRIGVLAGDYVEGYLKEQLEVATVVGFSNYISIMEGIRTGKLRAFAADTPTGIYHLKNHGLLGDFT